MLDRKLLRDLSQSKILLGAIACIVAVGVMSYVSMQSAYRNLDDARKDYYRQCRMADFWVDLKRAPRRDAERLARIRGVAEVRSRIQFSATVDLEDVEEPINALLISMPAARRPVLNDLVLKRGGYFTNRDMNEVIVTESFAVEHGIGVGDTVRLILNNRRQSMLVVGTAISSEFTYLLGPGAVVPDPKRFGVFFVKRRYAEDVTDLRGAVNQVVGRFSPDLERGPDAMLRELERRLDGYGVLAATKLADQSSNLFLSSEINGLGAFASVVPVIFLIVAALVLNVLIGRIARQQRTTIGTLKAIGYTNGRIFAHFLAFGLVVGAVGGISGGALGYLASVGMMAIYQHYFEFPELGSKFFADTIGFGLAISLVFAVLGALQSAWRMLRLQPAAAMRPEPPRSGGAVLLERVSFLWRRLSAGWRMVIRSLLRNRIRTATGVFSAAMGAGLMVCGFMMIEAQNFLVDFQFHRVTRSDVDVSFESERTIDAVREIRRMPGVDYAEPTLAVAGTFTRGPYRKKSAIEGLRRNAFLTTPRDASGEPLRLPETGVVLTRRLAEILGVLPGEDVVFTPAKGDKRPTRLPVALVADSFMGVTSYAEIGFLSQMIGEPFAVTGAQLKLDGDPLNRRALYRQLKNTPAVQTMIGRRELIDGLMETILESQWLFLVILVGFSGVIFFGSIVNSSIVNLAERQREVATMMALGYTRWSVGMMFLRESLLANVTGALFGLPIGYALTWLVTLAYDTDLIRLPVVAGAWIWIATLVMAIAFTLLAHAVVQTVIHRMDALASLKVME